MNRDDIIRMAREAGASFETAEGMFRFVALVAAAEREECAKVCDDLADSDYLPHQCAAAIRARGGR